MISDNKDHDQLLLLAERTMRLTGIRHLNEADAAQQIPGGVDEHVVLVLRQWFCH